MMKNLNDEHFFSQRLEQNTEQAEYFFTVLVLDMYNLNLKFTYQKLRAFVE